MSSKTKIVVLKSKELIYTGIFIVLGIMLILLLFYMFSPDKDKKGGSGDRNKNQSKSQSGISTEYLENGSNESNQNEVLSTAAPSQEEALETFSGYIPGVYSTELNLGGSSLMLSVSVDESRVTGVSIDNMDETLTAMYPLVQPSIDEINNQIGMVSSIEDITYSSDNKYTTIIILEAVDDALGDARK